MTFDGLPNEAFFKQLRRHLGVEFHDLEQAALGRTDDTFLSTMVLEAKVDSVVFSKSCELPGWPACRLQAVFIVFPSSDPNDFELWDDYTGETLLLALFSGKKAVKAGDFVFRLKHSNIFSIFRYERSWLRFIGWLEKFMAGREIDLNFPDTPAQHHNPRSLQLKDIHAPAIDFEVRKGLQKVEFGSDVFLHWMRHMRKSLRHDLNPFYEWLSSDQSWSELESIISSSPLSVCFIWAETSSRFRFMVRQRRTVDPDLQRILIVHTHSSNI